MNRQQNRERERIENKLRSWVKSWTSEQKKLFEKMVTNEVNKIEDLTEQVLNECFGVAIKEEFEKLTVEEINKILINANEYMEDYKKIIEESKGDYIEMVKALEPVIKKEIKAMIKEGKDKLEGIKELRAKHKVPQNELVKMWLDVKGGIGIAPKKTVKKVEEIPYTVTEKEIEEGQEVTCIITEKGIEVAKEIKIVIPTEPKAIPVNEVVKELGVVDAEFVNPNKPKPQIKTIIEWQYGTYEKSSEGVKIEDTVYKDLTEVEAEKEIVFKNLNDEEIKIKKEIENLNKKLSNVEFRREERNGMYAEISAVFAM